MNNSEIKSDKGKGKVQNKFTSKSDFKVRKYYMYVYRDQIDSDDYYKLYDNKKAAYHRLYQEVANVLTDEELDEDRQTFVSASGTHHDQFTLKEKSDEDNTFHTVAYLYVAELNLNSDRNQADLSKQIITTLDK